MTYEEKKEWLKRYGAARQLLTFRRQQLETAKTDAGRTTQNISPMPGGSADGQALPRAVERIQETEERVTSQAVICDEIYEEIMAAIGTGSVDHVKNVIAILTAQAAENSVEVGEQ